MYILTTAEIHVYFMAGVGHEHLVVDSKNSSDLAVDFEEDHVLTPLLIDHRIGILMEVEETYFLPTSINLQIVDCIRYKHSISSSNVTGLYPYIP